ncbi:sulfatase [Flavivirga amylovorans]|uniref:Sulfatase n=1 Tax=Flavivirga amylovorans TaxID=870486 RepID=A0ABT8WWZ5_9FLAO|nr:sulfatase [Flavivirga amylovorans]MDO5986205.1 sulfatase [Flavivirga amylovorans]
MNKNILCCIVLILSVLACKTQKNENLKTPVSNKDSRPNIIFLFTDDQNATVLGCMGNDIIKTPNIDKLADKGVLFERCYATSPLCMAARATVMTGMYEFKTGCNFQTGKLAKEDWDNLAYPAQLKKNGYRTAFTGKWGFGIDKNFDGTQYFDKWGRLEGGQGEYETIKNPLMVDYAEKYPHVTRALGAFGADFINESKDSGKPFCLSISFKAPHEPHDIIDPIDQKLYQDVVFPTPPTYGKKGLDLLPAQPKMSRQYMQRKKWSPDVFQDHTRAYYQLVSGVDAAVGMITEALEEAGVADNTIIIYSSDNGYHLGAHGLAGKVLPYETSSRIPLIIYDPRAPKAARGQKTTTITGNIDFAPTILDAAGLAIPAKMDGKSLMPAVQKTGVKVRESLGLVQAWDVTDTDLPKGLAVVTEDYKYIKWCYADENMPESEELFNLVKDPNEMENIATNEKEQLEKMHKDYDEFHQYWANNTIGKEFYERYVDIFDRNMPWQNKKFVLYPKQEPFRWRKWGKPLRDAYEDMTGEKYPEIVRTPEMIEKEKKKTKNEKASMKKSKKE